MEADVLSARSMADINGNNKISNAELEVLKLQELVRKLEKQNEQLRTRANAVNNCPSAGPHVHGASPRLHVGAACPSEHLPGNYRLSSPTRSLSPSGTPEEPFAYFQPSSASPDAPAEDGDTAGPTTVLDEVELLDLSAMLPVGERDSWLYVSPKARLLTESILSPLQWCRKVLDHPGPELELAKRTLCHRLDQAKRWRGVSPVRPYSYIEGLSTLSPTLPYSKPAALTESPAAPLTSSQSALQQTLPFRTASSLSERAPTFLSNSTVHNSGRRQAAVSPQSSLDSEVGVSDLEDDSVSMGYKLQDMTDVEVMARLQEESLRQDYASTSVSISRRSSSFSIHNFRHSRMDLEEEDEEEEGCDQLPPPQPRLLRTGSMRRGGLPHSQTFSSIRDCRRNSATPHYPSLGGLSEYAEPSGLITQTTSVYRNSTDKLQRSMPNLLRAPSMPSVPSMPCLASPVNPSYGPSSLPMISSLRNSQSFDSSNGLARLQSSIPPPGQLSQRVQSVGNFPAAPRHAVKATAYVSPTVQQGPTTTPLSSSASMHSISSISALSHPLKPSNGLIPQPLKTNTTQLAGPRSSLPRPASFVGISGASRASKIAPPTRSLLPPPKSLAALSALRDSSWKDGCY